MVDDIQAPRRQRRDYTGKIIGTQSVHPHENPMPPAKKVKGSKHKLLVLGIASLLVLTGGGAGGWFFTHRSVSPVPKNIQSAVSFPIYYPDQKKLPTGYTLDLQSFKVPQKNGVAYSVDYGLSQKLIFSVQPKPSNAELESFNASYIPLRNDYQTPVGKAEIGAYNSHGVLESLISLPTNGSTWLIITAPYNVNQDQLKQVLQSIKAP
jgi:hypothetical protein